MKRTNIVRIFLIITAVLFVLGMLVIYPWDKLSTLAQDLQQPTIVSPDLAPPFTNDCELAWHMYSPVPNVDAYATLNVASIPYSTNSADWRFTVPETGTYTVELFIPSPPVVDVVDCFNVQNGNVTENTSEAIYTITQGQTEKEVTLNQNLYSNEWVPLGVFSFVTGSEVLVQLRDLNHEVNFSTFVTFSSLRISQGMTAYLPQIYMSTTEEPPQSGSHVIVRQNQAFDSCYRPSKNDMQIWWNSSPYYIYNLYMGGVSNASCHPETLTASWIQDVSNQGWDFIPTWVGPQAPCTSFKYRFSLDPNDAFGEGIYEAELAFARAVNLGLTNQETPTSIIYYDMEAFYGADSACKAAVRSFLSGWSQRLHELNARSGVYGSACYYMPDWTALPNPIDDVWIASWYKIDDKYQYDPNANVWNVICLSSNYWTDHQRIRQYAGGHNETWGGVTVNIDSNITDGHVYTLHEVQQDPIVLSDRITSINVLSNSTFDAYQLVAPQTGWRLNDEQFFWTEDGGQTWVSRSNLQNMGEVLDAYFVDVNLGFLAVYDLDEYLLPAINIYSTLDGGFTWNQTVLSLSEPVIGPFEDAFFEFLDADNGWLVVQLSTGSSFSKGLLFSTQDGGENWNQRDIPIGDGVRFLNPQVGWTAGGAAGNEIYVTHDGGVTWDDASLIQDQSGMVFYNLPEFSSEKNGVLTITVAEPGQPRYEIYHTDDGGENWVLSNLIPLETSQLPTIKSPSFVLENNLVAVFDQSQNRLFFSDLSQVIMNQPSQINFPPGVVDFQFIDTQHGWVKTVVSDCEGVKDRNSDQQFNCSRDDTLWQTTDGGVTWEKIY